MFEKKKLHSMITPLIAFAADKCYGTLFFIKKTLLETVGGVTKASGFDRMEHVISQRCG